MTRKIFIVSTGLTGTHFLGHSLNELSEDIVSYQEPSPMMSKEGTRYVRWKHNTFRHNKIRNVLPLQSWYTWKFKVTRWRLIPSNSSKVYVEANSSLSACIPIVRRAFPDAEFIHIIRDPRTYIRSAIDRGWYMDNAMLEGVNPYYTGEMERSEWFHKTPFERASWGWHYYNKTIFEQDPDLTLDFHKVFKTDDHQGFQELIDFINPDIDSPDPNRFFSEKDRPTKFHILPPYAEWKQEWKDQIENAVQAYDNQAFV